MLRLFKGFPKNCFLSRSFLLFDKQSAFVVGTVSLCHTVQLGIPKLLPFEKDHHILHASKLTRRLLRRVDYNGKFSTMSNVTKWNDIPTWLAHSKKLGSSPTSVDSGNKLEMNLASKISIWAGDITKLEIDAIVNAANKSLLGGGGVDGAIHKAAGPKLREESGRLAPCEVGEAKITSGYLLPAKHVIHTVGPRGEKPEKLKECYEQSLAIAKDKGLRSIAFPCISTGVYGYPQQAAAEVALGTVKKYLEKNGNDIDRVVFCLFLDSDKDIYEKLLQKFFSPE